MRRQLIVSACNGDQDVGRELVSPHVLIEQVGVDGNLTPLLRSLRKRRAGRQQGQFSIEQVPADVVHPQVALRYE